MSITTIQLNIEERLTLIEAEASTLQRALAALGAPAPQPEPAKAPEKPPPAAQRPARPARTAEAVPTKRLVRALRDNPGASSTTLARILGTSPRYIRKRLQAMQGLGEVRREGTQRGTSWYVVTDELVAEERELVGVS